MKERIVVFIDSSNLFHAIRYLSIRIDYQKFIEFLKGDRYLVKLTFTVRCLRRRTSRKILPSGIATYW